MLSAVTLPGTLGPLSLPALALVPGAHCPSQLSCCHLGVLRGGGAGHSPRCRAEEAGTGGAVPRAPVGDWAADGGAAEEGPCPVLS